MSARNEKDLPLQFEQPSSSGAEWGLRLSIRYFFTYAKLVILSCRFKALDVLGLLYQYDPWSCFM